MKKFFESLFGKPYYSEPKNNEEKFDANLIIAMAMMNNFNHL